MLSKLRRLYRGLCWLMDVDCSMPWIRSAWTTNWVAMEELEKLRRQVTALEASIDIAAIEERVNTLERSCVVSVHEGRLPLNMGVDVAKPAICSPLTKMGLTATTDAQFRKMAEYLVRGTEAAGAFDVPTLHAQLDSMGQTLPIAQSFKTRELYISALAERLQAYAKGAR